MILGLLSRKYGEHLPLVIGKYAGDTLWALMVYLGFGFLFAKSKIAAVAVGVLIFSYGIELSQLYQGQWINTIRGTTLGGLILGYGFLFSDLICYTVGIAIGVILEDCMNKKEESYANYQHIYPRMRYFMGLGRKAYGIYTKIQTGFSKRPDSLSLIPDIYEVCNTSTIDSNFQLKVLQGCYPKDIDGALYICQCLGSPEAFMVGDTNIIRIDFEADKVALTNRLMWTPAALARLALEKTKYRFDFMGLMYLSPGVGIYSYTEGMYLLPDGRIAVTSDVDRPWLIERDTLKCVSPLGRREEWLPIMPGNAGQVMGNLFAGYNNSHVTYTDIVTGEVFLVNYQAKQEDGTQHVQLMVHKGDKSLMTYRVVTEEGKDIEICQSIHELTFSRDYIILADTAFVAGVEMFTPWVNAPLPKDKTVIWLINRNQLKEGNHTVIAQRVEVEEGCIHLIAEYENPEDKITLYTLNTPATNTAELLKASDKDLNGKMFPKHLIGYGTLPVLDLSSLGKHVISAKKPEILESKYLAKMPWTWGPYLYSYMGRQIEPFNEQDLFVLFKGFSKELLPERIYKAYKDVDNRRVPISEMVDKDGINHPNSICRISTKEFEIADGYVFPKGVLCYTICCVTSTSKEKAGYVIAGVVTDNPAGYDSSGSEYWIFNGDDLAKGPVAKLGDKKLCNATLFHTLYIPSEVNKKLNNTKADYKVDFREDYPKKELKKWGKEIEQVFDNLIYPYFHEEDKVAMDKAKRDAQRLSTRRISKSIGSEDVIGEEYVTDAPAFADRIMAEAERMWKTTGWKIESNKGGILVETKPVSGVFEEAKILMGRASCEVEAPAQEIFDLLVSPDGYAIIDPMCKAEDHKKPPVQIYDWKENCRLEAATAATKIPGMRSIEFLVLNAIDSNTRTFVSKSILHKDYPGGSKYSKEGPASDGAIRGLNTFAIKVEPISENKSLILMLNYIDIPDIATSWMMNLINTKYYFQPLYKRIKKAVKNIEGGLN